MGKDHSTRIITMWDSRKISGKLGCSTSRLMFGTRKRNDRGGNLCNLLSRGCPQYPRSCRLSVALLTSRPPSRWVLKKQEKAWPNSWLFIQLALSTHQELWWYKGNRQQACPWVLPQLPVPLPFIFVLTPMLLSSVRQKVCEARDEVCLIHQHIPRAPYDSHHTQ